MSAGWRSAARSESRMLSKWTNYSAYLVFKVSGTCRGFDYPLQEASVSVGAHSSNLSVRLAESENPQSIPPRMRIRPFLPRPRFVLNWLRGPNFPIDRPEDVQEPPHPNDPAVERQEDPQEPDDDRRQDREDMGEDAREPNHDEHPSRPLGEQMVVGKPRPRADGWKEILLGEFCNEEGDDGEVGMALMEIKGGNWKRGLIVQGIEIRPTK
ncbi:putative F-box protein PP2-B8 [Platanthera guangdongensis]|uniref:F-box protein PP2-B8 n=1 Tax=Platanthera guangdongensis TaxID=2320717 RepID=A0ABR2MA96_9ASPA